jgi:hypothetical protein
MLARLFFVRQEQNRLLVIIDLYRRKVLSCFALEFGDSRFDYLYLVVAGDIF